MNTNKSIKRRIALGLSALAIVGMGSVTVACSPRGEKPAETTNTNTNTAVPTEKGMQSNVTRAPISVAPRGGGGGNPAVPCGFGPQGGGPCGNNG
ncbi:MAG TPA: hypothetical protein PLH92_11665 [Mycobacterium sp.]|uniref:hypothetical protein n=1 Tax=Mycolicibacterium sp. TaxID=2320850 RepID=UPI0025FF66E8|nr:hypothetical protein [Mycolicibacterium sp.]HPX37274.1 hypothetical protein [Mycobacterium sp.]HQC77366.1 hypothetical protein [Mycobacterium sp.]